VWRNACETTHSEGGFWGENSPKAKFRALNP